MIILKLRYDSYYSNNNGWRFENHHSRSFESPCCNYGHVTLEICTSSFRIAFFLLLLGNIHYVFGEQINIASWTLVLFKMKRVFSRGTVLFLWLGFALYFFVFQISIFRVTSHVEKTSTILRLSSGSGGETNDQKTLLEVHVPLNGRCIMKKKFWMP